jgi:uncharacterized damage-inducible protein DinB
MSFAVVDRFAKGAELVAFAFQGLSDEQSRAHPGPGDWSLAELAAHLVDCDSVFAVRMRHVLAEERPTLQGFDENAWIRRLGSDAMPIDEAVALFVAERRWMTRILRSSTEADFARVGIHTERGPQTVAEIVSYATNHVDHHLKFAYAKRANLGISLYPRYTTE